MATTYYSTADLDALLKKGLLKASELDALLRQAQTKDLSLDSLLKKAQTKGLDLDAHLFGSVRLPKGFFALDYTGKTGPLPFAPGSYVVGGTSDALALCVGLDPSGATGTVYFDTITGTFQSGETIHLGSIGSELVANGDMELDSNWDDHGTPYGEGGYLYYNRQTDQYKHSGSYGRELRTGNVLIGCKSDQFITVADDFYVVSVWAYPYTLAGCAIVMSTGTGVYYHYFPQTMLAGEWTEVKIAYKEVYGGSKARIYLLAPDLGQNVGSYYYTYFDDVSVKGLSKDISNYATADGISYSPTPHLDALLTKSQSVGVGLDAELGLSFGLADPAYLSEMEIEASFGDRIGIDAKLSYTEIESRFGGRTIDPLKLSALGCESTISVITGITVDKKLSVLECESRFGIRSKDDLKLSALEIESEIAGAARITIDKFIAPLEAEIDISTPLPVSVDKTLSALESEIEISREQLISVDKNLSALTIEATIENQEISVDSNLSALGIVASISNREISVDSRLSALVVEATIEGYELSIDSNLSALRIEATISNREIAVDAKLSAMGIDASIDNYAISLDSYLAALTIDASIENYGLEVDSNFSAVGIECDITSDADNAFALDSKISALLSEIVISGQYAIDVDENLSAMGLESTILYGDLIFLDKNLSVLGIDATILWSNVPIVVDAYLSALVMVSVGTGAGSDGATGTITETDRFDDYTLRHSRW